MIWRLLLLLPICHFPTLPGSVSPLGRTGDDVVTSLAFQNRHWAECHLQCFASNPANGCPEREVVGRTWNRDEGFLGRVTTSEDQCPGVETIQFCWKRTASGSLVGGTGEQQLCPPVGPQFGREGGGAWCGSLGRRAGAHILAHFPFSSISLLFVFKSVPFVGCKTRSWLFLSHVIVFCGFPTASRHGHFSILK